MLGSLQSYATFYLDLLNIYLTYGLTAWGQACKTYIFKKT